MELNKLKNYFKSIGYNVYQRELIFEEKIINVVRNANNKEICFVLVSLKTLKNLNSGEEKGYYIDRVNNSIVIYIPSYEINPKAIEELGYTEEEIKEKMLNVEIDNISTMLFNKYKYTLEDNFRRMENTYKRKREEFFNIAKEFHDMEIQYTARTKALSEEKRVKTDILNIKNNPYVNSIEVSTSEDYARIEIFTTPLVCIEPLTERKYAIPETIISLDLFNGEVKYSAVHEYDERRGFWGNHQVHPHVSNRDEPCLGNAEDMLAIYAADREYYAMFLTALGFLQTTNINDIAGYGICFWDEIDDEGNVIKEGHIPEVEEYGKFTSDDNNENYWELYGYPDGVYKCEWCGKIIHYEDEVTTCSECGMILCADCARNVDGDDYCERCYENNFIECENCGEVIAVDNVWTTVDGRHLCEECYNEEEAEESEE